MCKTGHALVSKTYLKYYLCSMKSVLFVCLGNICRSPMAHGILRHKINKLGLNVTVDSAGTSGIHEGEAPDKRATATLLEKGINISDLRSQQLMANDFSDYDYIITMDEDNQRDCELLGASVESLNQPKMLMNFTQPHLNISVPDPYYGGQQGFEAVYEMLNLATDKLIEELQK